MVDVHRVHQRKGRGFPFEERQQTGPTNMRALRLRAPKHTRGTTSPLAPSSAVAIALGT